MYEAPVILQIISKEELIQALEKQDNDIVAYGCPSGKSYSNCHNAQSKSMDSMREITILYDCMDSKGASIIYAYPQCYYRFAKLCFMEVLVNL